MRPLLFVSVCLIACAGVQQAKEKLNEVPGALLFNGYTKNDVACFTCHNGDAKGTMKGPSLEEELTHHTDEQLHDAIKDGKAPTSAHDRMPAYKDRLSDEEIHQIVAWLHSSFPNAHPPAPAAPN